MSGLLFLTSDDFNVRKGMNGNILCTAIRGFSLILFYSNDCVHCTNLKPIYKRLPGSIGGCQFGMINVSMNFSCVQMSQHTIAPITFVPYIIMYVDGKPFMKYQGPHDEHEIKKFIIEVANNIKVKQQFINNNDKVKVTKGRIPEYCTGHPIKGDGKVCYLDFDEAYAEV